MEGAIDEPRARLLAIPGLNGATELLMAVAPRLFPGMHVCAFGHSTLVAEGGVEELAERALELIEGDTVSREPIYLFGESFGGTIALTIARRYPERVRGLVLLSTFARYPWWILGRAGMALWRLLGDKGAARVVNFTKPLRAPGALGLEFSRDALGRFLSEPEIHPTAYRSKCEISLTFDARPWLPSIAVPALVLAPTWDPVVPPAAGAEITRLMPNARFHRLPGGHAVHLSRPDEVGAIVARWLVEN